MSENLSVISIVVALGTVIVSLIIARQGWSRDQLHRDLSLRAECGKALSRLVQARLDALMNPEWNGVTATLANQHHIEALAAMAGMSYERRDNRIVRFVADESVKLEAEALRYMQSRDAKHDREDNVIGPRRGAILRVAAWMQQDIVTWLETGTTNHLRSFWSRYAEQLGIPRS